MKSRFGRRFDHDGQSAAYDSDVKDESKPVRAGYAALLDWVAAQAAPVRGRTVIDLGCGTGNLSSLLGRSFKKLVCVDISKRMLELAKRKLPGRNVEFVRSDMLGYFDGRALSADTVISTYAVHHLTSTEKALLLQGIAKLLRPGGKAIFGDLMFEDAPARRIFLRKCESNGNKALIKGINDEFYWALDWGQKLLRDAGFKIVSIKKFSELSWGISAKKTKLSLDPRHVDAFPLSENLWPVSVKGVIFNAQGEVLLLRNPRGEWELPGGRLEPGESPQDCLAREVREECGIRAVPSQPLVARVFEVIPGKRVLLVPFLCALDGLSGIRLSNEHSKGGFFSAGVLRKMRLPRDYASIIVEARKVSQE